MKNILLLAHDDVGQESRLQAALDVTRAVEGHLTCLDIALLPMTIADDSYGSVATATLLTEEVRREDANRARTEARLAHEDVPWDWIEATGQFGSCLRQAADLADLIVLSRRLDDFPLPDMNAVVGDVLVESGKPVLAVPEHHKRLDLSVTLVAWNGSTTAAAALAAAIPLLRLAERVIVIEVEEESAGTSVEEAAAYLSRHDIHARIEHLPPLEAGVARTIVDGVDRHRAGYVVMGGFGHRRLAEAVFGGVTRELLSCSPMPLFLVH